MMFFCPKCGARMNVHPKNCFFQQIGDQKVYDLFCHFCFEQNDGRMDEAFRLRVLNENILQREKQQV